MIKRYKINSHNFSKSHVLLVCYKKPYPLSSGAEVRIHQFIEVLSDKYDLDVLYIGDAEKNRSDKCIYNTVSFSREPIKSKIRMLYYFCFKKLPLQVGELYYPQVSKWLFNNEKKYDKILFFHIKTAQYMLELCDKFGDSKLYFDGTDCISLQTNNAIKVSTGIWKVLYSIEANRMIPYEALVYSKIKKSSLISDRDKSYLIHNIQPDCDPCIIPNYAIDLGYNESLQPKPYIMTFMGKMDYQPNKNSVSFFINEIFPSIKRMIPQAEFHVIGGNNSKQFTIKYSIDGVFFHGFVENAAQYLQQSALVVAPMVSGAGIQNKILQAMLLKCTVITSEIGAEGLIDLKGDELIIYKNKKDLIDKLICYLSPENESERVRIGANAQKYIIDHFSYDSVSNKIDDFFHCHQLP